MTAAREYPRELRDQAQRLLVEARKEEPGLSLTAAGIRIGKRVGGEPGHAAGLVQAGRDRRRAGHGHDER